MNTRYDEEIHQLESPDELRARARRIRERSKLLVEALGPEHPLVTRALQKARSLELEAGEPGEITLC